MGFQHTPLDKPDQQLRLLELQTNAEGESVSCLLTMHKFENKLTYSAISYTWGDPVPLVEIRVNDEPLTVRQNCKTALLQARDHLRRQNRGNAYIWIDSICIDQADLNEKSAQVDMMDIIYEDAETVLISLGPHQDNDNAFLKAAISFDSKVKAMPDDVEKTSIPERLPASSFSSPSDYASYLMSEGSKSMLDGKHRRVAEDLMAQSNHSEFAGIIESLITIASRPYWSRVWILQEMLLAGQAIVLGQDFDVTIEQFWSFATVFYAYMWDIEFRKDHDNFIMKFGASSMAETLFRFVEGGQFRVRRYLMSPTVYGCSDPRDRVYAVAKIVPEDPDSGHMALARIIPDYTKSVFEVAGQAVKCWARWLSDSSVLYQLIHRLDGQGGRLEERQIPYLEGPLQELIQQRQLTKPDPPELVHLKSNCSHPELAQPLIVWRLSEAYVIYLNSTGDLTIDIRPEPYAQPGEQDFQGDGVPWKSLNELAHVPDLITVLSPRARAGDVIAEVMDNGRTDGYLAVLRRVNDRLYEIIGFGRTYKYSALSVFSNSNSFRICQLNFLPIEESAEESIPKPWYAGIPEDALPNEGHEQAELSARMRLHLSTEDAMVLAVTMSWRDSFQPFQYACGPERFPTFVMVHSHSDLSASSEGFDSPQTNSPLVTLPASICELCGMELGTCIHNGYHEGN